jgi:hypothetical protein
MLEFALIPDTGILTIQPTVPLASRDFVLLNEVVDRYLSEHTLLQGILISGADGPGWEDLAALIANLHFAGNHQCLVPRLAAVTDRDLRTALPILAGHFTSAEIRHFARAQEAQALTWLQSGH